MQELFTLILFAALSGSIVLLRFFWERLPRRSRSVLVAGACIAPVIVAIAYATRWRTPSLRVNAAFYWICIASYELLLVLFTRLRPRWLTSIVAIILFLPLLGDSIFFPLIDLFDEHPVTTATIGDHFITQLRPWGGGSHQTSGTDFDIYYQPPWAPFLIHRMRSVRYYGGQCNAWAAYAVLQPDHESALMVCPAYPNQPPGTARSIVLPFQ